MKLEITYYSGMRYTATWDEYRKVVAIAHNIQTTLTYEDLNVKNWAQIPCKTQTVPQPSSSEKQSNKLIMYKQKKKKEICTRTKQSHDP